MGTPISRDQLLHLRLANHLLVHDDDAPGVVDVVTRLLAMQAQDFVQALWAVGVRATGSTRSDVRAALDSGAVVRSWPMRGTLHLMRPADLRWMLGLTAGRTLQSAARRRIELELDDGTLRLAGDVAVEKLTGGARLERNAFLAELNRAGISTEGQRGYHIIWHLAHTGLVCWGPPAGTQQALVLLDEWAPAHDMPDREEALRRFALGYFTGHGPATLRDFVWWSKLTVADAKLGLGLARGELEEFTYDRLGYWAPQTVVPTPSANGTHLLPGFDEYVLGYQDRTPALPPELAPGVVAASNGMFKPTLILEGRVAGVWRRSADGRSVCLEGIPGPMDSTEGLSDQLRAFERFHAVQDQPG